MSWRKHATSLALVLAACGLGAYAWMDRGSVSVGERGRRERNVFVAWRREDLTRISLAHGQDEVVLVRDKAGDGMWRMTAPRDGEVDAALVDRFLGTLEFATVVRKALGQQAGFDTPRARGTIEMGAVRYEFALGAAAPQPEGAAYLRMKGEEPIVVGKELALGLMQGVDAFRTRTLVPYLSLDLARLEVHGRLSGFTLERAGTSRAFVLPERGLRASRERLDKVWRAFADMRAESFVPDAEAEKAVADPELRITMTPKDGRPKGQLLVGGPCPGQPNAVVVVQRAPVKTAGCAPKSVLEGLGVGEGWLLDTRLFALHEDEIEEARLEALPGGAVLDVARKGHGFRELSPGQRDLGEPESDAALLLVRALAQVEGEVVGRDDARALLHGVRARVTLTHAEAGEEEQVELGAEAEDGGAFVRRKADGAVLRVSPQTARKLAPHKVALRPRALFAEPLAGRPVATIDTRCDGVVQHVTRRGDAFLLEVDGAALEPDPPTILQAIDALSRARADAWVADADDGTFGLGTAAAPTCAFHVTFAGDAGPEAAGVAFGAELPDGSGAVYARLDGDRAVLVAPAGLRAQLVTPFLDRHRLVVDPFALLRIEIAAKGTRRAFDPRAPDDGGVLLGDVAAGIVTETVHLGPARPGEGFDAPVLVALRMRADAGKTDVRFTVGARVERARRAMRFVRIAGLDATLAAPAGQGDALARLLGP